eukprot:12744274-Alexandrium_andersonii.AAC.1
MRCDQDYGQLRSESLADQTAQKYWGRFLLLVGPVDKKGGQGAPAGQSVFGDSQHGYLAARNI